MSWNPQLLVDSANFKRNPHKIADSITIADFLYGCTTAYFTKRSDNDFFVDFTNRSEFRKFCCGFHKFSCGFRKTACFWSNFEQYSVVAICPWNPKQQRRLNKSGNGADFATNLILACSGIRLNFIKYTAWPRNVELSFITYHNEILFLWAIRNNFVLNDLRLTND